MLVLDKGYSTNMRNNMVHTLARTHTHTKTTHPTHTTTQQHTTNTHTHTLTHTHTQPHTHTHTHTHKHIMLLAPFVLVLRRHSRGTQRHDGVWSHQYSQCWEEKPRQTEVLLWPKH